MRKQPHVVAVPYPAQGHVKPLLRLCYKIAARGIKVTFVVTEFIHAKVVASISEEGRDQLGNGITLASVPDGIEHEVDRKDFGKLKNSIRRIMPAYLTDLIEKINRSNNNEIVTCVIADVIIKWIPEVAETVRAEPVAFCPFGSAVLASVFSLPKLLGAVDSNGTIINNEEISLSEDTPRWSNSDISWRFPENLEIQKMRFEWTLETFEVILKVNWILCNTFYELDSSNCSSSPKILPVGPLLSNDEARISGNFWPEDASCLRWLDSQENRSVIYVAFGSSAVISQQQCYELALGLELAGRPFLWVVRSDFANGTPAVFPDGFLERVADYGKIVKWAPQDRVLAHISVACFLSHCGWNSTMEGLCRGVPILCWPHDTDQFRNQTYICDVWKVGLKLNPDENGIRSRKEIKGKIEMLLSDASMIGNALKLKDLGQKSLSVGGSSYENFKKFISHLKQ